MTKNIAVIGAGMFGYAMAHYLARNGHNISIYDSNPEVVRGLRASGRHPVHFTDVQIGNNITPFFEMEDALTESRMIISTVPAQNVREAAKKMKGNVHRESIIINLAKGLELGSNKRLSEVFEEELGELERLAVLSGGMFASELIAGKPLYATIASRNYRLAMGLSKVLSSNSFYPQPSRDLVGVEFAGPLKNVIAIAAGIGFGLGYEHASVSGFISAFSKEVRQLAVEKLGASEETFSVESQAWGADLMTTCFGKSRNREFGIRIGRGEKALDVYHEMQERKVTVEGYSTAKVVYEIARREGVRAPIIEEVYNVLYKSKSAGDAISRLREYGANGR